jgi:transposase
MGMSGGRPSFGVRHVDSLDASEMEKGRLKAILKTLTGELSVREACRRLSVGESRFHEIRKEVLQAAVDGLRPRRTGRPPAVESEESAEIRRLSRRIEDLEAELQLSWLRSEIAVTMPHLLDRPERVGREKKGSSPKRRRKRRRR